MFVFVGLGVVFAAVIGGFLWAGGKFTIIAEAAPHELLTIFGAGIGAMIAGNSITTVKAVAAGLGRAIKGEKWGKDDYRDLLSMMFIMVKTMRSKGVVALEAHIERPEESKLFGNYPKIAADHHVIDFLCDYLRLMTMNFEDAHQMADAMEQDMEKHHEEEHQAAHALQNLSDGLPAIGIVAAVLGIITTMGSIDQPVAILGGLIGSALTGTFLGVLLAYCIVAPFGNRLNQIIAGEGKFFGIIRTVMVAHLQGMPPQVSIELGRRAVPTLYSFSFSEMEEAINELPTDLI